MHVKDKQGKTNHKPFYKDKSVKRNHAVRKIVIKDEVSMNG